MQKVSKTEQDLQLEREKQMQRAQWEAFKKSMKDETEDNNLRIQWLKAKKELNELSLWYSGEEAKEKEFTKGIIEAVITQFKLEDKKEEMYTFFKIPIPKIEVGNIEDKKESELETTKTE
jgi:hypothetical protein